MVFVVLSACVDVMDRSCIEVCPVDCIYEGERKLYINPHECIDCGACEPECPVEAIADIRAVPEVDMTFAVDNARFFTDVLDGRGKPVGRPGGARDVGAYLVDTELVRQLPPSEVT